MIEIKTDGIRSSPKVTPLDVQPQRGRPQFREAVGLAGKTDDDIRFEALDIPRHHLCDSAERRLLCIIGSMRRLIQRGGESAELSYPSVQYVFVQPDGAKPGQEMDLPVLSGPLAEPTARDQHALASGFPA